MIPDDRHFHTIPPPPFLDADGCALFPGGHDWTDSPEWTGVDGRMLHAPFSLGEIGQFEMAWDCHVLETGYDLVEEEKFLEDMAQDPLVRELAQELLGRLPSPGGELAVEAGSLALEDSSGGQA